MSKTPQPNTMSPEQELGRTLNGLLQTALPVGLCVVLALWLLGAVFTARGAGGAQGFGEYDYAAFGAVPVSEDGRVKPLDTLARNTLLQLSGKQSLVEEMLLDGEGDEGRPAIVWLAEVFAQRPEARQRAVFRIDDPGVLGLMGLTVEDGKYFSMDQIAPHLKAIEDQAQIALALPDDERSRFQEHVIGLRSNIGLLFELQVGLRPHVLPPSAEGEDWVPLARSGTGNAAADLNPAAMGRATALSWSELVGAYRDDEPGAFNSKVKAHRTLVDESVSGKSGKAAFEQKFNAYRPFVKSIVLYILAGLMGLLGLLFRPMLSPGWARSVWRSGVGVLVLALVVHTAALLVRMWLQGRPPVTNLYSSAVFIGWAVVLFAVVMEVISRLGIASLAASIVGVSTLFIAHNLAKDGDTMGVMQAVLDSNFWLGTHVIAVTLGYAATFFAGFLALLYIVLGMATPSLDKKSARLLSGMVYAVICFALLFSFVGTVLGGIWADQSWGRFWGWDPKENGAIMIVLMNAIILHARWGHLVRDRGLMCLAVSGNIITAWSWFGTNLLEVGLHSYGFTEGAMTKLMVFAALNLLVIGVALAVPTKLWWSFRPRPSAGEPRSPKPQPAS